MFQLTVNVVSVPHCASSDLLVICWNEKLWADLQQIQMQTVKNTFLKISRMTYDYGQKSRGRTRTLWSVRRTLDKSSKGRQTESLQIVKGPNSKKCVIKGDNWSEKGPNKNLYILIAEVVLMTVSGYNIYILQAIIAKSFYFLLLSYKSEITLLHISCGRNTPGPKSPNIQVNMASNLSL